MTLSALPVVLSGIILVFAWFTMGVFVVALLARFGWIGKTELADELFLSILVFIWPLVVFIALVGCVFHYLAVAVKYLVKRIGGEK